ncbi:hypothetical protein AMIS_69430 [Actinoplanes missouriensis 431]|uniref:Uncharacterized protein n=1 Tax=Actinoplanes missouriensis (strain ATCC 14538 / DSM 43046 / CBS 188.64 / JCM 3121 / NBRC 102363 / NCIMB 12654 / NRRL B-3342 / UNCC 431) TaxID=512565 RepID=I0HGM6_ACTM4|nr:hypothetical protein [Actinoplanes missouriensis]BAL92163.1 hypothetical protein AMIS_69430 [Actinoplanes missouriensis 431]
MNPEEAAPPPDEPAAKEPAEQPAEPAVQAPPVAPRQAAPAGSHQAESAGSHQAAPGGDRSASNAADQSWTSQGEQPEGARSDHDFKTAIKNSKGIIVGDNATMTVIELPDGRQVTALRYHRSAAQLTEADQTFVQVPNFAEFVTTLRNERVVYECGEPGTGRRFLAERLAARAAAGQEVHGVHFPEKGVSLVDLARQDDLLVPDAGVVLELADPGTVTPALLDTFATLAAAVNAYLVIIGTQAGSSGASLSRYEIRPGLPDPESVLRRHLGFALRRRSACVGSCTVCGGACHPDFIERALDLPEIKEQLETHPRPASVADLAQALSCWDGEQGSLAAVLGRIRGRARDLAFTLVKGGRKDTSAPMEPRRQAVQIAYAAFVGYTLADVFHVGQQLYEILWAEQNSEADPDRVIFDGGVEEILSVPDQASLLRFDPADRPRRVRFVDVRMPFDILDVAWNDFDQGRPPVRRWLDRLVRQERPGIRLRAASVAGWLAAHDFDEVWRELIRPWALSESGDLRQAAAWAVDTATEEDRLLGPIRSRVREWARAARNSRLHDAAARAYGTRLGELFVREALDDLHLLAARADLNGSASIARTMQRLYLNHPAEIREELLTWMRDDLYRIQVHAARSLILIAVLAGEAPRSQWPRLLADMAADRGGADALVEPWRAALAGPTTGRRAWWVLHAWLRRADSDGELRKLLLPLCAEIFKPPLDGRARFTLRQWARECRSARELLTSL